MSLKLGTKKYYGYLERLTGSVEKALLSILTANTLHTDVANDNSPFAHLSSQMLIFQWAFHKLRLLPHLCLPQNFQPLMRDLK